MCEVSKKPRTKKDLNFDKLPRLGHTVVNTIKKRNLKKNQIKRGGNPFEVVWKWLIFPYINFSMSDKKLFTKDFNFGKLPHVDLQVIYVHWFLK